VLSVERDVLRTDGFASGGPFDDSGLSMCGVVTARVREGVVAHRLHMSRQRSVLGCEVDLVGELKDVVVLFASGMPPDGSVESTCGANSWRCSVAEGLRRSDRLVRGPPVVRRAFRWTAVRVVVAVLDRRSVGRLTSRAGDAGRSASS
jgi:hypothetical protein